MKEVRKKVLVIVVDILLLAGVLLAAYLIALNQMSPTVNNLLNAVVIIFLPLMFILTFTTFAGDKFDKELPVEKKDENLQENKLQEKTDSIKSK